MDKKRVALNYIFDFDRNNFSKKRIELNTSNETRPCYQGTFGFAFGVQLGFYQKQAMIKSETKTKKIY